MGAITGDMIISVVAQEYPETSAVFAAHGMGCLHCMAAIDETIEIGARMHGIDVTVLLQELNGTVTRDAHRSVDNPEQST